MKLSEVKFIARSVVGFVYDAVPGNSVVEVVAFPRVPLKCVRLVVKPSIVPFFDIVDIEVAGVHVLPDEGVISADAFHESAPYGFVRAPLTKVGDSIVVRVHNIVSSVWSFRAWMLVVHAGTDVGESTDG